MKNYFGTKNFLEFPLSVNKNTLAYIREKKDRIYSVNDRGRASRREIKIRAVPFSFV